MLELKLSNKAKKLLEKVPVKHLVQIHKKIVALRQENKASDVIKLQGSDIHFRATAGEYRIIFHKTHAILFVDVIGKRNDGEVYRGF